MQMRHMLVVAGLAATTLVGAGCTGANTFESLNDSFKAVKTTSAGLQNADLAGAAIATNLAAMELISAFASNANGVISAGGGNVIAPGGGNYNILQAVTSSDNEKLESKRKDKNGNPVVTATYGFTRTESPDGTLNYVLKSFDGKASGFTVKATGTFDFKPTGAKPIGDDIPATVAASLKGSISIDGKDAVTLDELTFSVANPLPDNVESLGKVTISNVREKTSINLTASVKNKVIGIQGIVSKDGVPTHEFSADENSQTPTMTLIAKK